MAEKRLPDPTQFATMPLEWMGRAMSAPAQLLEQWTRQLGSLAHTNAVFKTRLQKGGRISIPDAEREAIGLEEGALVQVIVIPIQKQSGSSRSQDRNQSGSSRSQDREFRQ